MSDEKTSQTSEEASRRAVEAFDSLPADSEYDTDKGKPEVEETRAGTTVYNQLVPVATEYFELNVEVVVNLPDGTRFSYTEAVEKDAADDYDLDEAAALLDAATEVMMRRVSRGS